MQKVANSHSAAWDKFNKLLLLAKVWKGADYTSVAKEETERWNILYLIVKQLSNYCEI